MENLNEKKQIEEMAKLLHKVKHEDCDDDLYGGFACLACEYLERDYCKRDIESATELYNAGYRKQSEGEWEEIGQDFANCSICGTIFEALPTMYVFKRNNIYCRHCGAKMKGGAE